MPDIEVGVDRAPEEVSAPYVEEETAPSQKLATGTILEAAFVDPAYAWPPADGLGKNAIELQASSKLLKDDDDMTTDAEREAMKLPRKPAGMRRGFFSCCRSADLHVIKEYEQQKAAAIQARKEYNDRKKSKDREKRKMERYTRVPEGILIYRLDTSNNTIELMSQPHSETNMETLVESMVVVSSSPSADVSRRGIDLVGADGTKATLVACEQRTAIAWLEAMDMMLANSKGKKVRHNVSQGMVWFLSN